MMMVMLGWRGRRRHASRLVLVLLPPVALHFYLTWKERDGAGEAAALGLQRSLAAGEKTDGRQDQGHDGDAKGAQEVVGRLAALEERLG